MKKGLVFAAYRLTTMFSLAAVMVVDTLSGSWLFVHQEPTPKELMR